MSAIIGLSYEELHPNGHQLWQKLSITDCGGGLQEFAIVPYESWSEPDFSPDDDVKAKLKRGEGDRERNSKRASKRARKRCRHLCKLLGATRMITLTTRENIQDSAVFQRLLKEFVRRVRLRGSLEYVAVLEEQERGALHVHMAVAGRQDYKLLWSIWQGVVGLGEGRVFVTNPVRGMNNVHRVAGYISKYIGKAFESLGLNKKRYWASDGVSGRKPGRKVILLPHGMSRLDCIKYVCELCDSMGLTWSFRDAISGNNDFCHFWMATGGYGGSSASGVLA